MQLWAFVPKYVRIAHAYVFISLFLLFFWSTFTSVHLYIIIMTERAGCHCDVIGGWRLTHLAALSWAAHEVLPFSASTLAVDECVAWMDWWKFIKIHSSQAVLSSTRKPAKCRRIFSAQKMLSNEQTVSTDVCQSAVLTLADFSFVTGKQRLC